jgi:hypothetical protein
MDSERTSSMHGLFARLGGVVLVAVLLYVLGAGPVTFYKTRYANSGRGSFTTYVLLERMYNPLETVEQDNLRRPLSQYRGWWRQRADEKYPLITWYY